MQGIDTYLESHRRLWTAGAVISFLAASFSSFMGAAAYFFAPDLRLFVLFGSLVLILDLGIGWTIHKRTGRSFRVAILISSVAVYVGATLVSVAIWRGNWLELVKEIFRSIGTTH
jgi:VIT1/CCC1 family predicted Fe2+/Mn2+ transporter